VWGPPSCEELLCDCCVGDVNLTFSMVVLCNITTFKFSNKDCLEFLGY
jgi:hypothetical protein